MNAKEYLNVALGGNMNIGTLTPLAFEEIMEDYARYKLLERSDNSAIIKSCPYHSHNKECIWGLRGCCSDTACEVYPELRK